MDKNKRRRRRQDLDRMKAKARKIYPHDKQAKSAEYLAQCSCGYCGNPRRHNGELTRQEIVFKNRIRDI